MKPAEALNLRDIIDYFEKRGLLVRVREPVDPVLEISEITDRVSKKEGPALLFENVKGSSIPVLINLFGSNERMSACLGVTHLNALADELEALLDKPMGKMSMSDKIQMAGKLVELSSIAPKSVSQAPCQEEVYTGDAVDLTALPILKTWPKDANRFITYPLVLSKDPETGRRNMGVYRMQLISRNQTFMHWQTQKDAAVHAMKRQRTGGRIEVAVAIGCDPQTMFAGVAPLPYGVDELLLSGYLRKKAVTTVKCKSVDLEVPAESEIVLEGYVDLNDRRPEGPFGDHTGVYTPEELFPVFNVTTLTRRRKPIYVSTLVGKPPMEDYYIGKAIERFFLPLIRKQLPEVKDMNFPKEGTFNNAVIVSIEKQYPFQARKTAHAIWGLGQLMFTKAVIVVESSVNVQDLSEVALTVFNNVDPKRDCFFVEGPVDTLNHASPLLDFGSKIGIDATAKWKEEGYSRQWPQTIEMDPQVRQHVDRQWPRYGIKL